MKTIYRIARAELRLLFYSPIAWFILIIFIFQSGLLLTDLFKVWIQRQESIGDMLAIRFGGLTQILYANPRFRAFFPTVQTTLYLYVPLITMGLMSREISSGSIKLLLSSPIKISQIVLGKFFAMTVYCFLFILILLLYAITGNAAIIHMDFNMTLAGLLGIYLLICTYSAIGLFMSSLTSYQIVAAISTLVVLAALNYVGQIGQNFAIVRVISDFLSMGNGRTLNFFSGLISTRDTFYFLIVTGLFLCMTIIRLSDGRKLRSRLVKTARYTLLMGIFLLAGYISSRPSMTCYCDMTANKSQTISPNSQNVIRKVKEPLRVTAYTNLLDKNEYIGIPDNRTVDYHFWERYQRFVHDMQFNYVYYYDTSFSYIFEQKANAGLSLAQLAHKVADSYGYNMDMFQTPSEMKKQIDFEQEEHRFLRILELGPKKSYLRVFDDNVVIPLDHEVIASIARLVGKPPKVAYVAGDYERNIAKNDEKQYAYQTTSPKMRPALVNQGFDVDTVFLENQEIPEGISALIIADPQKAFTATEMEKISRYLADGGNMIIAGEPGRQDILNPLLNKLGVRMHEGILIQPTKDYAPDHIEAGYSESMGDFFDRDKFYKDGAADMSKLIMSGVVGLEYARDRNFKITPIVVTNSNNTWNKMGSFSTDTSKLGFNPEKGDTKESVAVALALTRKIAGRQQRIMVFGDADFMSNQYAFEFGNTALVTEMFKWMTYGAFPIETNPAKTRDNDFRAKREDVSTVKMIFLGIIPGILLIWGAVFLIRRKRK